MLEMMPQSSTKNTIPSNTVDYLLFWLGMVFFCDACAIYVFYF